jgi:hypothetical protein
MTKAEALKKWINVGKFSDFVEGKRQIIIYINTSDLIWHIGVIINE